MRYLLVSLLLLISSFSIGQGIVADTTSRARQDMVPGRFEIVPFPEGKFYIVGPSGPIYPGVFTVAGKRGNISLDTTDIHGLGDKFNLFRIQSNGLYRAFNWVPLWNEVSGRPTYFPADTAHAALQVKFNQFRARSDGLYKPINYVPSFTEITARPAVYPSNIANVTALQDSLLKKANVSQLNYLIGLSNSKTDTTNSYSRAVIEGKLATKAPKATTLAGYNITDGATITQLNNGLAPKLDASLFSSYSATNAALLDTKPTLLSLASLRALTTGTTPARVMLSDPNRIGEFRLDAADNTSLDNGCTIHVTAGGKRYKRVMDGPINAREHCGAKGDNSTDDTAALNAALAAAGKANSPASYTATLSPANGFSNTCFIPHGLYVVTDELRVPGSITVLMEGSTSYGGTRIQQRTSGKHLFHIVKDDDNTSSGVRIINGILKGGVNTSNPTGLVYGGKDSPGNNDANNNSTYIEGTQFATPEKYAVWFERGDDIKLKNVVFDVAGNQAIKLGSTTTKVTNSLIDGATFYDIRAGVIDLENTENVSITNCKVYTDQSIRIPYFVNAAGTANKGLKVSGNNLDNVNRLAIINQTCEDTEVSHNTHRGALGRSVEIGGGQIVGNGLSIVSNTISGTFTGTVNVGTEVPDAPIFGFGTGVKGTRISDNTIRNTAGTAATPMLLPDNRTSGNLIKDNILEGFADIGQVANPLLNGVPQSWTYNTSSWTSTSVYNQVIPPGVFEDGKTYLMKAYFSQPGNNFITMAYYLGGVVSNASGGTGPGTLSGTSVNYNTNNQTFNFRYKRSAGTGFGTNGLEAAPSVTTLTGTLTVTVYPFN